MKKRIMAIVSGLVVAMLMVSVCEYFNHLIYPPPTGMDPNDIESIKLFMQEIPTGALVGIWLGWMISTFIGSFVSGKIDKINWKNNSFVIGGVMLLISIVMIYLIPHPIWMIVITILGYIPVAFLGSKVGAKQ